MVTRSCKHTHPPGSFLCADKVNIIMLYMKAMGAARFLCSKVGRTLWFYKRFLRLQPTCSQADQPPLPQGAADTQAYLLGDTGTAWDGNIWKFTVSWEVSAFTRHYSELAEAAVNSGSPLLTSISRLLGGKKTSRTVQHSDLGSCHQTCRASQVSFAPKGSGSFSFGVNQAKAKGPSN